jgi:hypothetical protein
MRSGASGGRRGEDEDGDDVFEPRQEAARPPAKGESSAGDFGDFDEEDFDDEFDDDFEEELEDEYELSEFEELTDDDLADDDDADVTQMGDFVDEDDEAEEPTEEGGAKAKGKDAVKKDEDDEE